MTTKNYYVYNEANSSVYVCFKKRGSSVNIPNTTAPDPEVFSDGYGGDIFLRSVVRIKNLLTMTTFRLKHYHIILDWSQRTERRLNKVNTFHNMLRSLML